MRLFLALGAVAGLWVAWQREDPGKLLRLQPLIGEWDMTVRIIEPRELSGEMKGSVSAKWAMDSSYVELIGRLDALPEPGSKAVEGRGYVTYDEDASYPKRAYRGYFFWSNDGRWLSLKGNFSGQKLVMSGAPLVLEPKKYEPEMRTTTTFKGKDAIQIDVDGIGLKGEAFKFLSISLRRR